MSNKKTKNNAPKHSNATPVVVYMCEYNNDNITIDYQEKAIEEWMGKTPSAEYDIIRVFTDYETDPFMYYLDSNHRDGFLQMLNFLKSNPGVTVLTYDTARFSPDMNTFSEMEENVLRCQAKPILIEQNADLSTPEGHLVASISVFGKQGSYQKLVSLFPSEKSTEQPQNNNFRAVKYTRVGRTTQDAAYQEDHIAQWLEKNPQIELDEEFHDVSYALGLNRPGLKDMFDYIQECYNDGEPITHVLVFSPDILTECVTDIVWIEATLRQMGVHLIFTGSEIYDTADRTDYAKMLASVADAMRIAKKRSSKDNSILPDDRPIVLGDYTGLIPDVIDRDRLMLVSAILTMDVPIIASCFRMSSEDFLCLLDKLGWTQEFESLALASSSLYAIESNRTGQR